VTRVPNTLYRRYVLATLTLVYTLNYLDRTLVYLLAEPIKREMRLSDAQLGFLTGIAFGLFYAALGVPIARLADRGNRSTIASIAIGLWGFTVMACVFVTNYWQLLLARIAAAVGEAGCMPPTYSLIGDYFPGRAERNRAMGVYMLANPFSVLMGFLAGGLLNKSFGWRITFFLFGIPGLLVALLVKLTIDEPRKAALATSLPQSNRLPMSTVLSALWGNRSCRHLTVGIVLLLTMGLGMSPWYAAFMIRSHGMDTAELGLWFGLIFGIGGVVGTLLGSYVTAHWFFDNECAQMRLTAFMNASLVPCFVLFLLAKSERLALMALMPLVVVLSFFLGPTFSLLQRLVADEMRATSLAVVMLLANLIGMGIGPQVVGILSDMLQPAVGTDSLRYSMLAMSSVALWAAYHFWQAGRTVREDLNVSQYASRIKQATLQPNSPL
jgi:MFS family permease